MSIYEGQFLLFVIIIHLIEMVKRAFVMNDADEFAQFTLESMPKST